ncbi:MAG: hypothetical protein ACLS7B_01065 [Hominilimicola sp.]
MSYLQQLISNSVLITALIGWFAAQVLKMIPFGIKRSLILRE